MDTQRIRKILQQHEGLRLEFKQAATELPKNLFESICAMLNREGGDILLGVKDDGTLIGVDAGKVESITADLVNLSNNPSKLDPPFILHPQLYTLDDKLILHIAVPESSEVHRSAGIVFDRGHEGDYKVTQPSQIALLYNRKRNYYTEGYNLAAVLLFGKDETILNVVSHYKIDALVRRDDLLRYDDRLYIQTNLIEAYDQLMAFVEKHLPDKFFLQGDRRVSLRSYIFREVIANLIIHREYINAHPATFIIYKDSVEIINANNPHGNGLLLPENFVPFPKNPLIAKFFIQLGRVDELGSGVLNVYRFLKYYSPGQQPQFIEGKLFKTVVPIGDPVHGGHEIQSVTTGDAVNDAVSIQVRHRLTEELKWIQKQGGVTLAALIAVFGVKRATGQRDMKQLKDAGLIIFSGADRSGKYILTEKGKALFGNALSN